MKKTISQILHKYCTINQTHSIATKKMWIGVCRFFLLKQNSIQFYQLRRIKNYERFFQYVPSPYYKVKKKSNNYLTHHMPLVQYKRTIFEVVPSEDNVPCGNSRVIIEQTYFRKHFVLWAAINITNIVLKFCPLQTENHNGLVGQIWSHDWRKTVDKHKKKV